MSDSDSMPHDTMPKGVEWVVSMLIELIAAKAWEGFKATGKPAIVLLCIPGEMPIPGIKPPGCTIEWGTTDQTDDEDTHAMLKRCDPRTEVVLAVKYAGGFHVARGRPPIAPPDAKIGDGLESMN